MNAIAVLYGAVWSGVVKRKLYALVLQNDLLISSVSQIRQLEMQEVEQEHHRRSVHRLSAWERPCHDFDTHGKERSESFTLPAVPREKLLAQATEFDAKLFQEDQPLSTKEPELRTLVSKAASAPVCHTSALQRTPSWKHSAVASPTRQQVRIPFQSRSGNRSQLGLLSRLCSSAT